MKIGNTDIAQLVETGARTVRVSLAVPKPAAYHSGGIRFYGAENKPNSTETRPSRLAFASVCAAKSFPPPQGRVLSHRKGQIFRFWLPCSAG